MADKRVTVTIEAIDKASSTIKSIGSQLSSLGKLGDIKELSNFGNNLRCFVNGLNRYGNFFICHYFTSNYLLSYLTRS